MPLNPRDVFQGNPPSPDYRPRKADIVQLLEGMQVDAGAAQQAVTDSEELRDATSLIAGTAGSFKEATLSDARAAGRAAVADGEVFVATGDDVDFIGHYERVSASTDTELLRYPKKSAFDALSLFPNRANQTVGEQAALGRILSLVLFGADPSKVYTPKFHFWKDVGTRYNLTFQEADDLSGTNAVDATSFAVGSGADAWDDIRVIDLAQVGGSGITGKAIVDFTNPASFTTGTAPSTSAMYQRRRLNPKVLFLGDDRAAQVADDRIDAAEGVTPGARMPFADGMSTKLLRQRVRDVHVQYCDEGHRYGVSALSLEQFVGINLTRFLVDIYDFTADVVVARYRQQVSALPSLSDFKATIPETIKITDHLLAPNFTGIEAVVKLDLTSVTAYGTNNYTTPAQCEIHTSRCLPDAQVADYLDRDYWHERITVGAAGDFATLTEAVESLHDDTSQQGGLCFRSHYNHRILIDIIEDGTHVVDDLVVPAWVSIRGTGADRCVIDSDPASTPPRVLQYHYECKILDVTVKGEIAYYPMHSDDFNRVSIRAGVQRRRLRQSLKRVKLIGGLDQNAQLFGSGISSGQTMLFEDVEATHLKPDVDNTSQGAAFGIHNTGPTNSAPTITRSPMPATVTMRGCRSASRIGVNVTTLAHGARNRLTLQGCQFNLVLQTVSNTIATAELPDLARDRFGWDIGGVHEGAILYSDPLGTVVLQTTPGVPVSGDAAGLIFGAVDDLGRGEKWVLGARSIGARLGDRSGDPMDLTIGAQTHTFDTNLTAVDNATIIGQINASITDNPVSLVDIQHEIYPDCGFTQQMLNDSGVTIDKGYPVKRSGLNTIAKCAPGDRIFGWVVRPILAGAAGKVITSRQVHQAYVAGRPGVGGLRITEAGSSGTDGSFALEFSGGGGTGAAGTFTVSGGAVTEATLTSSGSGYSSMPNVVLTASSGLTGASVVADPQVQFGIGGDGQLDFLAATKVGQVWPGGIVERW